MIVQVDEYVLGYAMRDRMMPTVGEHSEDLAAALLARRGAVHAPPARDRRVPEHRGDSWPTQDGEIIGLIQQMIDLITAPERFERGLQRLLDGFELEIEKHNTA